MLGVDGPAVVCRGAEPGTAVPVPGQTLPDLLRDLDEAADVDRRKKWLDELIEKKQPAAGHETQEAAAPKEPAPPAAAKVGAAGAAPARKVSAFAPRSRPSKPNPRPARRKSPRRLPGRSNRPRSQYSKIRRRRAAGPVAQSGPHRA